MGIAAMKIHRAFVNVETRPLVFTTITMFNIFEENKTGYPPPLFSTYNGRLNLRVQIHATQREKRQRRR
jgi:hypothetical protein